jgi:undecaprenyl-diphosphatase
MNGLAQSMGGFLTPFFKIVSYLGEKGIFFIICSLVLMLFKKTRRWGFTTLLAIGIGALFTNVIIKNLVARPRPYTDPAYTGFWQAVGAIEEGEFSFPSGHTTVTMVSMTIFFLTFNKKWSWVGFLFVLLMGVSRVYLVAHYTTDVICAMIVGLVASVIAYILAKLFYNWLNKNKRVRFARFFLNSDVKNAFKR